MRYFLSFFNTKPNKKDFSFFQIASLAPRSGTNYLSYLLQLHPLIKEPIADDFPHEQYQFSHLDLLNAYIENTTLEWNSWVKKGSKQSLLLKNDLEIQIGNVIVDFFRVKIDRNQNLLLRTPHLNNIQYFFNFFPTSKIIVLIRDGRDVADSYYKSNNCSDIKWFEQGCELWQYGFKNLSYIKDNKNVLCVKYEELFNNTKNQIKIILDFLKINSSSYNWKSALEAPVLGSSFYRGTQQTQQVHWTPIKKEKDFNPLSKWVNWNDEQKAIFKAIAGTALIELEYVKDNNW